jgi:hypothetical protein
VIHPHVKQFPADKNYILKEVQSNLKTELLVLGVQRAISNYLSLFNPLGLKDETVIRIEAYQLDNNHALHEFYLELAAIYRYLNHGNQLELLFDGTSHYQVFASDWKLSFLDSIDQFSKHETFLKAFLGASVFYPGEQGGSMISNRLKSFLNKWFQLKVYKYWGVKDFQVA